MEVLAHSFGVTVRFPGYQPVATTVAEVIQIAASRARGVYRNGYVTPRMPDPNP